MRYIALSVVLCVAFAMSACVPSLHALYTDKDVIFDAGLLGDWVEAKADSKGTLTISKAEAGAYKVVSSDGKDTSSFSGHLVKLADKRFLDLTGDSSVECHTLVIPVHMWFLISQTGEKLQMRDFSDDWLGKLLKREPTALKHEFVDNDLVLTASTSELQSFVMLHVNTKGAFEEQVDYVRKK
jgi:hypothetical protein